MIFKPSEKGQGLIEYALILIFVAIFVIGILGFGFAFVWNLLLVPLGAFSIVWWQAVLIWLVFGTILGMVRAFLRRPKIVIVLKK